VKRREFITLLGGAAAAWPLAARAQRGERMRRVGVLHTPAADDPEGQVRIAAFLQGLEQFGWTDGGNVRIETRWAAGDADRIRRFVAELVMFAPDVIVTTGSATSAPYCRQPALCRSCSWAPPIRLARASSKVWRGQVATSPVLPRMNTALARNGWSCSSRVRRA
jgi:hypothetical protein